MTAEGNGINLKVKVTWISRESNLRLWRLGRTSGERNQVCNAAIRIWRKRYPPRAALSRGSSHVTINVTVNALFVLSSSSLFQQWSERYKWQDNVHSCKMQNKQVCDILNQTLSLLHFPHCLQRNTKVLILLSTT